MTNANNTVLYTGVTSDLLKRVNQHRSGEGSRFTSKYKAQKLIYFELTERMEEAITREKQIKAGSRQKKIDLVNEVNPEWNDLFGGILP